MARKLFFWLHKWIGLLTGLIVLIVSLTGCIYVFSEELKEHFYKDRLFIEVQTEQVLPLSILKVKAQQALGESYKISRSEIYSDPSRSWIFRASETDAEAFGYWNYYKYYYRVYVNPYNGDIVHIEDSKNEFFQLVLSLHMNLLLGERIGSAVVGYAVTLFVLIMLSGLVLWWPQKWTKKKVKGSLRIKWDATPKRLIYDLHNVLGFYMWMPILIITLTGLMFSFKWSNNAMQFLFNGGKPAIARIIPKSSLGATEMEMNNSLDKAVATVFKTNPTADVLSIRTRAGETAPIDIQTRLEKSKTSAFVWYYFDRKTGELMMQYGDKDVEGGQKLDTMKYDIHVGSIGGLGTKFLAFVASFVCASLPITGFLMWYNKRRKKSRGKPNRNAPHKNVRSEVQVRRS